MVDSEYWNRYCYKMFLKDTFSNKGKFEFKCSFPLSWYYILPTSLYPSQMNLGKKIPFVPVEIEVSLLQYFIRQGLNAPPP